MWLLWSCCAALLHENPEAKNYIRGCFQRCCRWRNIFKTSGNSQLVPLGEEEGERRLQTPLIASEAASEQDSTEPVGTAKPGVSDEESLIEQSPETKLLEAEN